MLLDNRDIIAINLGAQYHSWQRNYIVLEFENLQVKYRKSPYQPVHICTILIELDGLKRKKKKT